MRHWVSTEDDDSSSATFSCGCLMQAEHTAADYYFDSYAHFGEGWVRLLPVVHA